MKKPKILIVEDEEYLIELLTAFLGEEVRVVSAKTLTEGERVFKENSDIELVVMDCCVPGKTPNSMWLVQKIRKNGFTGPIIAKSSDPKNFQKLLDTGASHSASIPPIQNVSSLVLKLLKEAGED